MVSPKKVRLNADLAVDVAAMLKDLAEMQNISMTEALSRAIRTESLFMTRSKNGSKILLIDESGVRTEVIFAR